MGFSDLKTEKGIKELNSHLADKSYINGYLPSSTDIETFNSLAKAPTATLQHALRWYNHIKSFSVDEQNKFTEAAACPLKSGGTVTAKPAAPVVAVAVAVADDDDVDLFGSDDDEDAEAAKIREDRLSAYAAKKEKKPALIAKSSILLDVKPWDDETDMKTMETNVRSISMDGLLWGASKLVPVGYGIHKLQIMCVIEDDKVSVDLLTEKIEKFEDYVQSVDIAAFNKI